MNTNLQETGRFLPMCGFTGFTNHIDNSNAVLQEMLNRIKHRGRMQKALTLTRTSPSVTAA